MFTDKIKEFFFHNNIEDKKNDDIIYKAFQITKELGKENYYGRGEIAYVYNGYGLVITLHDSGDNSNNHIKSVCIEFKGDTVLYYNKYNHLENKHVLGIWEELLDEIYQSLPVLTTQRNDGTKFKTRERNILYNLQKLIEGDHIVSSNISVYVDREYSNEYCDVRRCDFTRCYVYLDDDLVFESINSAVNTYEPGDWENDLLTYIKKQEEYRRYKQQLRNEKEARDNIKKLRKQRSDFEMN